MPGSDSGKKSINTRDETPHVTATLRDTVQCSLGPVQGAVVALWEYSQSHLNTNAFVKYSNHSLGTHLPWRPVNLDVSLQRQFHFPRLLFTCLMKN